MERAQTEALEPIRTSIMTRRDHEMRARLLQYVELRFIGWPEALQNQTLTAIRDALNRVPTGTSQIELEKTRDQVI
jgi:hypothetical protein